MKHLFTITRYRLLFMTLTLCTTQIFGMESKQSEVYTYGTQQYSPSMPPATAALTPQAMQELNRADDTTLKTEQPEIQSCEMCDMRQMCDEICETKTIPQQLSKLYQSLFNIIATMPPELINIILDYLTFFKGECQKLIKVPDCDLYTLIEAAPGVIAYTGNCGLSLWNIETAAPIKTFPLITKTVILPLTSNTLALGFLDGNIILLNWKTEMLQEANAKDKHILSVAALSKLSDQLFASVDSVELKLWESKTGKNTKTITLTRWFGIKQLVALTQNIVAVALYDGRIYILNVNTNRVSNVLSTEPTDTTCTRQNLIALAPTILAAPSPDSKKRINLWDWNTGQHLKTIQPTDNLLRSFALSSNKLLAMLSFTGCIELYNPETGRCQKRFEAHSSPKNHLIALSGNRLASVGYDSGQGCINQIKIWE